MVTAQSWYFVALSYIDFAISKLFYLVLIWFLIMARRDLSRLVNHFTAKPSESTETKEK